MNRRLLQTAAIPVLVICLIAFFLLQSSGKSSSGSHTLSSLKTQIDKQQIKKIEISPDTHKLDVTQTNGSTYTIGATDHDIDVIENHLSAHEQSSRYNVAPTKSGSIWSTLLINFLPFIVIIGIWLVFMNQMQGGGSRVMSFGKSRAKRMAVDAPKVTFKDVAGVDEAVEELHEIKEFLENPKKFQALGARIPKGVLLFGPPGTGKTLLARAVAGEAGVPFFSISGSDFVEMFVGVGASRVRDLFEQAKLHSPCIIFVDEIDAVGRHRGAGMGGGNDEREQTLNQLLVEMDGFEMKDNIIIIAATNRPDILDPALLRPGRFDRQVKVDAPDRPGREQILAVHSKGKPLAKNVDLPKIAGQTPGFTGADLANLVNEGALLAARHGKKRISMAEFEEGIMRVIAGPEKKARLMSIAERRITAVHEMGHALLSNFLDDADPVHKISVVGRGMALGYVVSLPQEDRFMTRKAELMARLAQALGGRTAEELVFDDITTGAESDFKTATSIAKRMVMQWGMSEKLGPRVFGNDSSQPFLGRDFHTESDYSDDIAREIDSEIHNILEQAHTMARTVLSEHREDLERLADILVEHETIDSTQFAQLLAGEDPSDVFPPDDTPTATSGEDAEEKPSSGRPAPTVRPRPGFSGSDAFTDTRGHDAPGHGGPLA